MTAEPPALRTIEQRPPARERVEVSPRFLSLTVLVVLLALGIFLRIFPSAGFQRVGYDEHAYAVFVRQIEEVGIAHYPTVVHAYVALQKASPEAMVPATRIAFLVPAALIGKGFHLGAIAALRSYSCLTSVLLLLATALIGYRHGGMRRALVLSALMAIAPLQIALAQRALVDGPFAFLAVLTAWFFWERIEARQERSWLVCYAVVLFLLVLTKENAAFVFAALLATGAVLLLVRHESPDWPLLVVSLISPALAVIFLATLVGGLGEWVSFYRMFVAKSVALRYSIQMQDGAWYRYLIDFVVLSPCVAALALARIFQIRRSARSDLFWALFLGFSFLTMASVCYGMSVRYAAYWDEPLRWLAASQLIFWTQRLFPRRALLALCAALLLVMAVDFSQYTRLFVRGAIYDPVSVQLLHASDMVK